MTSPEVHAVGVWHEALNDGDADLLVGLSHPEVEVGGPRGTGNGTRLLREWVERANIRLAPVRFFQHGSKVVVEQEAQWRSAEGGQVVGTGRPGSIFEVREGRISSVLRYETISDALQAANLDASHEV